MRRKKRRGRSSRPPRISRTIQDGVFRFVFNHPEEARQLAETLGLPVCEKENLQILTIRRVVTSGIENDLAFALGDNAIVMIEAQTTSPVNIPCRMLGYCSEAAMKYIERHNTQEDKDSFNEYSEIKVKLPVFRLFAVCPHLEKEPYEERLYEGDESDLNIRVQVITSAPEKSLLGQYMAFCRKYRELYKEYGNSSEKLSDELMKWCKDNDILWKYLEKNRTEVIELLRYDYVRTKEREAAVIEGRRQGHKQGLEEGLQKGHKEGRTETQKEIAGNLFDLGMSVDQIIKCTGLSREKILKIRRHRKSEQLQKPAGN